MENIESSVSKKSRITVLVIAIIGFITTIKLAAIYYAANFAKGATHSFCSINEFIDCDGIARTTSSQFLGIPLAYWGMLLYLFIIAIPYVYKLVNIKVKDIRIFKFLEVFKNPYSYIASLGYIAFIISMILAIKSLFVIKKICVLCVFTYFLNLAIALVITGLNGKKVFEAFKDSFVDFKEAIAVPVYKKLFIIVVLLVGMFLTYTRVTYDFAPQVRYKNEVEFYYSMPDNIYKVSGNDLGDKNGDVVVKIYSDFECPICSVYNRILHKVAKDYSNVYFEHHNLPLDKSCNKFLDNDFHKTACMLAKYSLAAEKQGRYWEYASMVYDTHPETEKELFTRLELMGYDMERLKKDSNDANIMHRIANDIDWAFSNEIKGTPAIVIVNKKTDTATIVIGLTTYKNLTKQLKEFGAKKKHIW